MHDRRGLVLGIPAIAALAIVVSPFVVSIVRTTAFHEYGGPHWLLVLSNLPFLIVALLARGAPGYLRVCVATIGIGSGAYHARPGDELLALDWAPIVLTLMLLTATVADHRVAFALAPLLALGSVGYWLATGGTTDGGNMAPYVTTQLAGVIVPPLIALADPRRANLRWLLLGVAGFVAARAANLFDHSLKHLIAAAAAWCALRATTRSS